MKASDRTARVRALAHDAAGAVGDVQAALDIQGRVERNPYRAVAVALGAGYLLGGGLFTPLTARVLGRGLRVGFRLAVLPIIQEQILGLAQDALGPAPTSSDSADADATS